MVSLRTDRWSFFAGEAVEMEAWICNDTHDAPAGATLRYQMEIDGHVLQSGRAAAKVPQCSARPQGLIRFTPPECAVRTTAVVRLALVDRQGHVLHDTAQTIELFPACRKPEGKVAYICGPRQGKAATLAHELGLKCRFAGDPARADVILVDDATLWAKQSKVINDAVAAGALAVLLELPVGVHSVGGDAVTVVEGGMGKRHFVSRKTGHALVAGFTSHDFWFWHDATVGYPTPLLETVVDPPPPGWAAILSSGNGSWQTDWRSVPAALEKKCGRGIYRICQIQLPHRTQGNPVAATFAVRLLEKEG
jgi:hypothetical protein